MVSDASTGSPTSERRRESDGEEEEESESSSPPVLPAVSGVEGQASTGKLPSCLIFVMVNLFYIFNSFIIGHDQLAVTQIQVIPAVGFDEFVEETRSKPILSQLVNILYNYQLEFIKFSFFRVSDSSFSKPGFAIGGDQAAPKQAS